MLNLVPQKGRAPYLLQEDKAILRYIIDGHHESVINGSNIWKQMERDQVCASRSWQSLRNRFFKNIAGDISRPEYELTQDERTGIRAYLSKPLKKIESQKPKRNNRFMPKITNSDSPDEPSRTFALYTLEEDKAIIKYILDQRLECFVKGNNLWVQMEIAKICPSRTWQSLKSRFKRYIISVCADPQYGLSSEEQLRLKMWISPPPPPPSPNKVTTSEASGLEEEGSVGINSDTSSEDETIVGSKGTASTSKSNAKSATNQKDFFSIDMSSDSDD